MFNKKRKLTDKDIEKEFIAIVGRVRELEKQNRVQKLENAFFAQKISGLLIAKYSIHECPFCAQSPEVESRLNVELEEWSPFYSRDNKCEFEYKIICKTESCGVKPETKFSPNLHKLAWDWNRQEREENKKAMVE